MKLQGLIPAPANPIAWIVGLHRDKNRNCQNCNRNAGPLLPRANMGVQQECNSSKRCANPGDQAPILQSGFGHVKCVSQFKGNRGGKEHNLGYYMTLMMPLKPTCRA